MFVYVRGVLKGAASSRLALSWSNRCLPPLLVTAFLANTFFLSVSQTHMRSSSGKATAYVYSRERVRTCNYMNVCFYACLRVPCVHGGVWVVYVCAARGWIKTQKHSFSVPWLVSRPFWPVFVFRWSWWSVLLRCGSAERC